MAMEISSDDKVYEDDESADTDEVVRPVHPSRLQIESCNEI